MVSEISHKIQFSGGKTESSGMVDASNLPLAFALRRQNFVLTKPDGYLGLKVVLQFCIASTALWIFAGGLFLCRKTTVIPGIDQEFSGSRIGVRG